jgi:hypothetical protein
MPAVAVNGVPASVITTATIGSNLTAGTPVTFNVTLPAGTDCLAFEEVSFPTGGAVATAPTAVTYNGVALTMVPGSFVANPGGNTMGSSIWYLLSPPTGSSLVLSVTYGSTLEGALGLAAIPLIGVNQSSPVGIAATATGNSITPAVTATGAGENDLYMGISGDLSATTIASGGSQTSLWTQISRGSVISAGDSLPGSGSGAFSWTVAISQWAASAVAFQASTGAPNAGALILAGQAPQRIQGTRLTPGTAKIRDKCREAVRSIFLPGWKRDLAHG